MSKSVNSKTSETPSLFYFASLNGPKRFEFRSRRAA
jgi:hypothetical protein